MSEITLRNLRISGLKRAFFPVGLSGVLTLSVSVRLSMFFPSSVQTVCQRARVQRRTT